MEATTDKAQGVDATWIQKLTRVPALHHAIRVMRVQSVVRGVLGLRPIVRKLPSGIRYRVRHLESMVLADEIFRREIYRRALEGRKVETFVDLGCNVGYFPCYVAHFTGRRDVVGLAVDGNEAMVRETQWHVDYNGLSKVACHHGAVGFPKDVKEVDFYLAASNVASSAQPKQNPLVPEKGKLRKVRVPTVDLAEAWQRHAGDREIDVLKIDVEGSECDVLRTIPDVLKKTRAVVVEWHKWITTGNALEDVLGPLGFEREVLISEDEHAGVAVFVRKG